MPAARLMVKLVLDLPEVAAIWDVLPEARIVGGAVRDGLLARAVADVDFACPLLPAEVMSRLQAAGIKAVPTGLAHGTVTAVLAGRGFEITTLRRDVLTDGRHAVVAFTDDWQADASRRDFTINAMSAARDGTVFDYFEGLRDLAAGTIRFVGAAELRIREDFLRILRFFRFYARYGAGAADAESVTAIRQNRDGVASLSAERVWGELKNILSANDPGPALVLMRETGVLDAVMPGADVPALSELLARGAPAEPLLRIAALLREPAEAFAARLRLSGDEAALLTAWLAAPALRPAASDAEIRVALADEAPAVLIARSWLARDAAAGWARLRARILAMERPVFPLRGRDLAALGVGQGPRIGAVLARVRQWWQDGGCVAGRAACLALARQEIRDMEPACVPTSILNRDPDAQFDDAVARDTKELGA